MIHLWKDERERSNLAFSRFDFTQCIADAALSHVLINISINEIYNNIFMRQKFDLAQKLLPSLV